MTPVIRISKGQPCPTSLAPYSGKFFNVHKFHRMPPETLEEIFMLLFSCNAHTTPLPVDVPAPHANLATWRNDEAKKQEHLFVLMYARHMTSSISTLVHFFVCMQCVLMDVYKSTVGLESLHSAPFIIKSTVNISHCRTQCKQDKDVSESRVGELHKQVALFQSQLQAQRMQVLLNHSVINQSLLCSL